MYAGGISDKDRRRPLSVRLRVWKLMLSVSVSVQVESIIESIVTPLCEAVCLEVDKLYTVNQVFLPPTATSPSLFSTLAPAQVLSPSLSLALSFTDRHTQYFPSISSSLPLYVFLCA
jgi:hypothetical protein